VGDFGLKETTPLYSPGRQWNNCTRGVVVDDEMTSALVDVLLQLCSSNLGVASSQTRWPWARQSSHNSANDHDTSVLNCLKEKRVYFNGEMSLARRVLRGAREFAKSDVLRRAFLVHRAFLMNDELVRVAAWRRDTQ
jgi:hypothetical protein